jgi:hypothetical protein
VSVESALLAAFTEKLGPVEVLAHNMTPWSSATFSGARHLFRLETEDPADIDAFAQIVGEADIPIPRGFVADIVVVRQPTETPYQLTVEALTIDA